MGRKSSPHVIGTLWIGQSNYRLTEHGTEKFIECVGPCTNANMLFLAYHGLPYVEFVWRPDRVFPQDRHLVTVFRRTDR